MFYVNCVNDRVLTVCMQSKFILAVYEIELMYRMQIVTSMAVLYTRACSVEKVKFDQIMHTLV